MTQQLQIQIYLSFQNSIIRKGYRGNISIVNTRLKDSNKCLFKTQLLTRTWDTTKAYPAQSNQVSEPYLQRLYSLVAHPSESNKITRLLYTIKKQQYVNQRGEYEYKAHLLNIIQEIHCIRNAYYVINSLLKNRHPKRKFNLLSTS